MYRKRGHYNGPTTFNCSCLHFSILQAPPTYCAAHYTNPFILEKPAMHLFTTNVAGKLWSYGQQTDVTDSRWTCYIGASSRCPWHALSAYSHWAYVGAYSTPHETAS